MSGGTARAAREATSGLPEAVRQSLRSAFSAEVAERLPRIEAREDLEAIRRDVHTLSSSAWVVGATDIARLARAVEDDIHHGPYDALVTSLKLWAP